MLYIIAHQMYNQEKTKMADKHMAKAEDLTGKRYGYLEVEERTEDRITKSGQKKVRWICKCLLCGNHKAMDAQDIKKGKNISCGCYKANKENWNRNKKICVICGKKFESPPSDKTVTCSKKCSVEHHRRIVSGKTVSEETKKKMSESAKGRDMSLLQVTGTEAAKKSPNSGRFETNVNAIEWHLISPDNKNYYFKSLNNWLRENCEELFGCKPDSHECKNVESGLRGAKRAMLGKNYGCCTYKGWQVIPTDDDYKNSEVRKLP